MLGFPMLIALHSVGMAIVVGLSLMVALRLNGIIAGLDAPLLLRLLKLASWGFLLNLATGLALFITRGPEYITSFIFLLKMGLVIVSGILLVLLRERLRPAGTTLGVVATDGIARALAVAGTAGWFAAVVTGRLIPYLSSIYR
jgi:hypothetical protein